MGVRAFKTGLGICFVSLLSAHCGAPNKSAGQVSAIFNADPKSLAERVTGVCSNLKSRTEAPSTSDLGLPTLERCENAGENAVEVSKFKGLKVEQYTASNGSESDKKRSSFRVQLWLNGSVLSLASIAGNMKKFSDPSALGGSMTGKVPVDLDGAVNVENKIVEPMKLDMENGVKGSTVVNITVTGLAKADLTMAIDFAVLEKSITAVIKTKKAEGILADVYMVAVVVPYAGDTYLDLIGSIKMGDITEDAALLDAMIPKLLDAVVTMLFDIKLPEKKAATEAESSFAVFGSDNFTRAGFHQRDGGK